MSAVLSPSMTIKLLCFAQLRDRLGDSEMAVSLPNGATGRDLLQVLKSRHPRMEPLLEVSRLAVNCEYVSADAELHDGDDVVVIPPVSGG